MSKVQGDDMIAGTGTTVSNDGEGSVRSSVSPLDPSPEAAAAQNRAAGPESPATRRPLSEPTRVGIPAPKCKRPIRVARPCPLPAPASRRLAGSQTPAHEHNESKSPSTSKRQRTSLSPSAFTGTAPGLHAASLRVSRLDDMLTEMCFEFMQQDNVPVGQ
jgi:hypothetical protein